MRQPTKEEINASITEVVHGGKHGRRAVGVKVFGEQIMLATTYPPDEIGRIVRVLRLELAEWLRSME